MASKKLLRDFQKDPGSQFLSIRVQDTRGTPYILRNWGDGVAPQGWGGPSFTTLVSGDPPSSLVPLLPRPTMPTLEIWGQGKQPSPWPSVKILQHTAKYFFVFI